MTCSIQSVGIHRIAFRFAQRIADLLNLEAKKMAGVESSAMLLAADLDNKPFWLSVDSSIPPGTKIK